VDVGTMICLVYVFWIWNVMILLFILIGFKGLIVLVFMVVMIFDVLKLRCIGSFVGLVFYCLL